MKCPFCENEETKVVDKREGEGDSNRRRRECGKCGRRFTTYEKIEGLITKVKKRDGRIVDFEPQKIKEAIWKAAQSVGGTDEELAHRLAEMVAERIEEKFAGITTPHVEQIQDVVEKVLVESGHYKTAKAYILYRKQHEKIRKTKQTYLDVINTIGDYINEKDWRVKENSNEAFSFSGLMLYISGKTIANYVLNEMHEEAVSRAHIQGYMHMHDLSHGLVGYCSGWSLKNLLLKGFGGVPGKVDARPAKHLNSAVNQMVNFLGCMQMEFAGAQAFSSFDTYLAPFVAKDKMSYEDVKQEVQSFIYHLNVPSRWGSQYPFTNITLDWVVPEDIRNQKAIIGGEEQKETYGDFQDEMEVINKAFLEVMGRGDNKGRIFTFPIPTYNLYKDFNWNTDNANLLFDATAKYGFPYFQNYIGSDLDPKAIRSMCCRLMLDKSQLLNKGNGLFGAGEQTGSIGVVTLNMNRLAYESKTEEEFLEKIKHYATLAKNSLEVKREVIEKNIKAGLMPYAKSYLGNFSTYFSTIGLVGMNEACLNLLGKNIATKEGKKLAINALIYLRDVIKQFQQETGHLYNLEATPAESASYRLAKLDKEMHPDIKTAGTKMPYLTNSTHLPVNHTNDPIEAMEHQNDIQPLYTGGTVFHTFLGERMTDGSACKLFLKRAATNTKLPYISITPTFSVCPVHGYVKGEHFKCPCSSG
jgi:ribonucleoside-triphosphate reductase